MSSKKLLAAAAGAGGAPSDPNFNRTVLLLHGDGNQGANNLYNPGPSRYLAFTDNSSNNFPIVVNGDAYGDNFSPFSSADGNWSAYFGGSGNYIRPPSNAAFSMGTGNFTIEAWINIFTYTNSGMLFDFRGNSGFQALAFYLQSTGRLTCWTGSNEVGNTGSSVTVNVWNHVAFVRNSGTIKAYLNGVEQWSLSIGNDISNNTLTVASSFDGAGIFTGYMSNVRLVKGTAVYTSNFTPSTTPLTAISGTSLLTCQSNRFVDKSANNFAITTFGTVTQTKPVNPFSTTYSSTDGSGYFDGTGDYLISPANANFNLGGGDFTVEGWFYVLPTTANPHFFQFSTSGTNRWNVYRNTNFYIFSAISGVNTTSDTGDAVLLNQWFHLAVVKSSTTTKIYLNGVEIYSDGRSYPTGNMQLSIGFQEHSGLAADYLTGWASNFRVVKGTAVYTGNFTPPTALVANITNTQFLTCQYQGSVRNVGFIDSSPYDNTINRTGNTTQGTFSPFSVGAGQWSNVFEASSGLTVPAQQFPGDFTWELWYYPTALGSGTDPNYSVVIGCGDVAIQNIQLYVDLDGSVRYYNGSTGLINSAANSVVVNQWAHIALVRSGSTTTLYVNGVSRGSGTDTGTKNIVSIGCFLPLSAKYNVRGHLSNVRTTTTAVYTSAFTPPTAPLTAISGTSLLLCQANRFIDNSASPKTVTVTGNVIVSPFSPLAPTAAYSPSVNGGSAYFDGTGDSLSVVANTAVSTGSDNFTLEAWVWSNAIPTNILFDFRNTAYGSPAFYTNSSGQLRVWDGNVEIGGTGTAVSLKAWNHIAFVRSSNTLFAYLNGVQQWSAAFSPNMSANSLRIGAQFDSTGGFSGYMSGIRLTKGQALYTTTFTTPTAPPIPTVNTGLLLNFTNAGIFDQTGKNVLETVGNAQVDTNIKKYGTGSMKFDGSGDYLLNITTGDPASNFGSGNFTIEMFVYHNQLKNYSGLIGDPNTIALYTYTSGAVGVNLLLGSGQAMASSSGVALANTWQHYAIVRNNTVTTLYVDGISRATFTSSGIMQLGQTAGFRIGSVNTWGDLNGFIDDLRITKGVARYTANFTPPALAFPDK